MPAKTLIAPERHRAASALPHLLPLKGRGETWHSLTRPGRSLPFSPMRPPTWLPRLIAFLWSFSRRSWIDVGMGLRPRSGSSALVLFLFLIFFLIGLALMLFGFGFGQVDRWLDAQGGWLDAGGSLLFRALFGLIVLVCFIVVAGSLFDWRNPDRLGLAYSVAALVIGYFAWFGLAGD